MTQPTTLDGTTQPGYAGVPIVELSGNHASFDGLRIAAANSMIRGFVINGFSAAIRVHAPGLTVKNCYIGLDADGSTILENTQGIRCDTSCIGQLTIGGPGANDRNVISGNQRGIDIDTGGFANVIQANYIGTDATGMLDRGNASGIHFRYSGGLVGGATPALGNVISGNDYGIYVEKVESKPQILNNLIGVAANGTSPLGNGNGVYVNEGRQVVIGEIASPNTIAHNTDAGVLFSLFGDSRACPSP